MEREECPVCGIKVKVANLPRHLRNVHPHDKSGKDYAKEVEKGLRRRRTHKAPMSPGTKKVVRALAIISIIIVLFGLVFVWYLGLSHPKIEVYPSAHDFGDIQRETVITTFEIRNAGKVDLRLTGVSTSCGCTSAVVRVRGIASPTFGLHDNPKDWSAVLSPGETATLEVSYDAGLHPDTGSVMRVVYIKSNDPFNPEVQVDITANVIA
ncbi:MAG: DUF1573 domain-containing protein [Methanomassiliicoccales archaeon]|nr:MAG: DUF1573 domain-containing protein [Methanomassiliicoccales archaeon]